jgi:hypothetical protein
VQKLKMVRGGFTVVGGPGAIKMWRPLPVTTNLGYIAITHKQTTIKYK